MITRNLLRTILIIGPAFLLSSCMFEGSNPFDRIEGEGPIVSEEFDLSRIRGIVIRNSAEISLTQGNQQKIVIEGQRNIIDNLTNEVSNGIWYIGNKKSVWRTKPVNIKIRISDIEMLRISGSGKINTINKFTNLDDLDLRISGSGDMNLNVEADDIKGQISGSGSITLSGEARDLEFNISGSGSITASELKANNAYAKISGSGGIHLDVKNHLEARISGSGDIYYHGDPEIDKHISGSGNVRSR